MTRERGFRAPIHHSFQRALKLGEPPVRSDFHFLKARRKITQRHYSFENSDKLEYLIFKPGLFLGLIQGTGAICLSQILISFPLVVLNNRNKVMGIKLLHREKDPSH